MILPSVKLIAASCELACTSHVLMYFLGACLLSDMCRSYERCSNSMCNSYVHVSSLRGDAALMSF